MIVDYYYKFLLPFQPLQIRLGCMKRMVRFHMYSSPLTGFPKKSIAWNRILRPILVIENAYLIADYQECDELVEHS